MALRRYQHTFLQPLEIDQERVASSQNTNLTTTNLTVTNSTVTNQTVSKLSTNNFFNSATPDYTPSSETLTVFGDRNVSTGSIATIRVNNVSVNDADAFGGLKLSSSQGNDFIIGKRSVFGTPSLQIRNSVGNSLLTLAAGGQLAVTSVTASSYGSVGNFSGLFGQIRVGADEFGNTIKVVNDTNLNLVANNAVYFNVGASTAGTDTGTNVGFFGTNGLYFPSGKGIDFSANANAAGMTSELLDDYEEGTWTPVLIARTSPGGSLNYTQNSGRYIKIGDFVFVSAFLIWNSGSLTGGTLQLGGLPFNSGPNNTRGGLQITYSSGGWVGSGTTIYQQAFRNETNETNAIYNFANSSDGKIDDTASATIVQSTGEIMITGCYTAT